MKSEPDKCKTGAKQRRALQKEGKKRNLKTSQYASWTETQKSLTKYQTESTICILKRNYEQVAFILGIQECFNNWKQVSPILKE